MLCLICLSTSPDCGQNPLDALALQASDSKIRAYVTWHQHFGAFFFQVKCAAENAGLLVKVNPPQEKTIVGLL